MENKLSELSKPVAWIIGEKEIEEFKLGYETFVVRGDDVEGSEPKMELYSKECVSALLARIERLDAMLTVSVQALEAADQRIAELETVKAAAEKLVRCKGRYHSEQNYRALAALFGVTTPDLPPVDGDSEAVIAELRAKIAKPVRLPDTRQSVSGDRYQWSDGVFNYKQDAIALLREQGFIIEGGE